MKSRTLFLGFLAATTLVAYQDYYQDSLTSIDPTKWYQNGSLTPTAQGLTSTSVNGGSLISKIAVPDGTSDYQVFSSLTIGATGGGTYYQYLRASTDAMSGPSPSGTFWSVELRDPAWNGSVCSATLAVQKRVGGILTLLGSTTVPCWSYTNFMSVIRGGGGLGPGAFPQRCNCASNHSTSRLGASSDCITRLRGADL